MRARVSLSRWKNLNSEMYEELVRLFSDVQAMPEVEDNMLEL